MPLERRISVLLLSTFTSTLTIAACANSGTSLSDARLSSDDSQPIRVDAPPSTIDAPSPSIDGALSVDANADTDAATSSNDAVNASQFAGGDGSLANPFQISNAVQLIAVNDPDLSSDSFQVIADIDLTGVSMAPIGNAGGDESFVFTGNFDGHGHQISNWMYASEGAPCDGLFGDFAGIVHDVTMINTTISGGNSVGALAGCSTGGVVIRNRVIGGELDGVIAAGAVGAQTNDDATAFSVTGIADTTSTATVNATNIAGGLVGQNSNAQVVDSYATGAVDGSNYSGGVIGLSSDFSDGDHTVLAYNVARVYAAGVVQGGASGADAVVPCARKTTCSNVGDSYFSIDDTQLNSSTTAAQALSSTQMMDKSNFVGWNFPGVWTVGANNYPDINNTADAAPLSSSIVVTSTSLAAVRFSFPSFDLDDPSGDSLRYVIITPASHGAVVQDSQGSGATYQPDNEPGFDDYLAFQVIDSSGVSSPIAIVWFQVRPQCNPADPTFTHGGDGSSGNPYVVSTVDELQLVHAYTTCNFVLGSNLDLTGVTFPPIGNTTYSFSASFDGGGHSVSNWTYASQDDSQTGFFSVLLNASASIQNLQLLNVNVSSTGATGALAGGAENVAITNVFTSGVVTSSLSSDGSETPAAGLIGFGYNATLTGCGSSATVVGNGIAGGLIGTGGDSDSVNHIVSSYATGSVTSSGIAGGLGGSLFNATFTNSYSTASVSSTGGTGVAGGLVGDYYADSGYSIQDCYVAGAVSAATTGGLIAESTFGGTPNVVDSFWDLDVTDVSSTYGGAGSAELDAAMQMQSTYINWDFTNVWSIGTSGYPQLR